MNYSELYEQREKSVVRVIFHGSSGTGAIVGDGKTILTCAHCCSVNHDNEILDSCGNKYQGKIVFRDPDNDIAVLKVASVIGRPLEIGNSDDVKIGDEVFTIGFPFARNKGLVAGHVSSIEKAGVIRLDASLNPGNSGGPLLNEDGLIMGIINMRFGAIGEYMKQAKSFQGNSGVFINGISIMETIVDMVNCMDRYLNVGIGYAIPSSLILNLAKEYIHV